MNRIFCPLCDLPMPSVYDILRASRTLEPQTLNLYHICQTERNWRSTHGKWWIPSQKHTKLSPALSSPWHSDTRTVSPFFKLNSPCSRDCRAHGLHLSEMHTTRSTLLTRMRGYECVGSPRPGPLSARIKPRVMTQYRACPKRTRKQVTRNPSCPLFQRPKALMLSIGGLG